MFLLRFLVCHYKVMNHFHWSWADLSSTKEANVIVGEKGSLPVIQGCVVSGYWYGPKHLAALSPLPDMCAQHALLLCGSLCGEDLAFHFKAAQWQVSREIGAFCLGWWNIIFFWEGRLLFQGVFLRAVGPLSCSAWERGGCHPCLLAVSPCVVLPCDTAENSPRSNHPCPHFSALSWDLAMLTSSPSAPTALHILGNGKEFHSLVCPLLPFEFWYWLPLLATPLGVFWRY